MSHVLNTVDCGLPTVSLTFIQVTGYAALMQITLTSA